MSSVQEITAEVEKAMPVIAGLGEEISKVLVGQKNLLESLFIGLLTDGHVLVEGVPGLAKTTAIKAMAESIHADFSRIQFTPDLLPADLVGTQIFNPKEGTFSIKHGPVRANLVLADEINRAPAKVQSALLEAMQERQVTIGDETFKLPEPFLVMATQNPVEQEGTYPLPEAQVDRFMMKVVVNYPTIEEEKLIMQRMSKRQSITVNPTYTLDQITGLKEVADNIFMDDKLFDYIANLVAATREPDAFGMDELKPLIEYGASPRASIFMVRAAKAFAFLQGRGYVTPQDIKSVGLPIMRHRIMVSYEAEAKDMTSDDILTKVFDRVDVP